MATLSLNRGDGGEGEGEGLNIDQQFAFTARMDNVKILSQLLKSISFR